MEARIGAMLAEKVSHHHIHGFIDLSALTGRLVVVLLKSLHRALRFPQLSSEPWSGRMEAFDSDEGQLLTSLQIHILICTHRLGGRVP